MLPELYAKLADEYGMTTDEARRFVLEKMGDQIIPPFTTPGEETEAPITTGQESWLASLEAELNTLVGEDYGTKQIQEFLDAIDVASTKDLDTNQAAALIGSLNAVRELDIREEEQATRDFWGHWMSLQFGPEQALWIAAAAGMGISAHLATKKMGPAIARRMTERGLKHAKIGVWGAPVPGTSPSFLSRLLGRFRTGGGGGLSPAFAALEPDPLGIESFAAGRGGVPTVPVTFGGVETGARTPGLLSPLSGEGAGWLDPETGEFKIPRSGLIGAILGPKIISPERYQEIRAEETAAQRLAEFEEINRLAAQRAGTRRFISVPSAVSRFQRFE